MKGFVDFVREQGVVGMAVGIAIGAEAGAAVKAIVANLINPIVGFILGDTDLSALVFTFGAAGREAEIGYGAIISAIISLLAVAWVVFYLVKKMGLDKLDKETEE